MSNEVKIDKKKAAQIEAAVDDAIDQSFFYALDADLLEVEAAGPDWVSATADDQNQAAALAAATQRAAEAQASFNERFQVNERRKALWAAKKIAEARTALEDLKEIMKREVERAKNRFEHRESFFKEKLRAWAALQKHEGGKDSTYHIVRLPEAGVRLEVRPKDWEGVEILDEQLLLASLLEQVGSLVAYELGLVESRPKLMIEKVREHLSKHPEIVPKLDGVVERKKTDDKNLVIVRL